MILVNRNDFSENNRIISESNYNVKILNQHISDAQFVDVQKLMGIDFYNDLIRNSTSTEYQTLLNGGTYTYNGKTYTNYGLKSVIVFYAYARYILMGSQTDTPFGYVEKNSQNSTPVNYQSKKSMFKINQQTAYNYWESVRLFIERNKEDYPLWDDNCVSTRTVFRISKISR
tara:strand:- start:14056 stop:14571 length:516 start_codon:yes stop_codon:yes gene_type:complete